MRHGVRKDYLKGSRRNGRGHSPYPFDRFLASRVGRAWDDVYSELCSEFDNRSWVGYSFRRDLHWHVAVDCWIGAETGTIYNSDRWGGNMPVENEYYVHPWTGILSYAPKKDRPRREIEVTKIVIDNEIYLEKLNGIWYRFQITRRWTEKDIWGREYERTITTQSQLGKAALRTHCLRNDNVFKTYPNCLTCGSTDKCVHRIKEEAVKKSMGFGRW